ncbi:methyl-accepting chemotaxis protein [Paraburkholderia sp. MM5496-R1]
MNRLSLNTKLWLALLITWLGLLGLGGWAAWQSRATMLAERKSAVQNVVESAYGIVADYAQRADQHELTPEQARQQALARLSAMRYPGSGYMIVSTATPVVIMHPMLADLRNKDVSHYADSDGKLLFVEMVKVAQAHGQGFVDYMGRLAGNNERVPKISFVKRFAAWDWYLISGVYVNDIDAAFRADLLRYLLTILAIGSFSTVALVLIIRNVKRSLGGEPAYAASVAETIADGDLSCPVTLAGDDQESMLYAMQRMQSRLADAIRRIRGGTETITVAAEEIAAGNLDLSARTEQQASSLGETAASMEQLTATVKQNADNALQANRMARSASQLAGEGGEAVQHVVANMQSIAASSARVVDIIGVIESIAFQTNILALNAAVEARARRRGGPRLRGRRGRGAQPRAPQRRRGQGDQDVDRGFGRARRQRQDARREGGRHDGVARRCGEARDRHHQRDFRRVRRAEPRHRAGQSRDRADGRDHAAERGDGRTGGGRRAVDAGAGADAARRRQHVPPAGDGRRALMAASMGALPAEVCMLCF